ncbi:hypothetical protein B0O99DRAFT_682090 [Bisporella sp. PMI_857]|nr:hypothetical protein B0O99DRAFT_590808 [Bisporella sp. PMI_857]KAH8600402.1 hypothetical protein B0O99DRAFT_682090 [Bisporella sp. PMI_857]
MSSSPTIWTTENWATDGQDVLEHESEYEIISSNLGATTNHESSVDHNVISICPGLYGPDLSQPLSCPRMADNLLVPTPNNSLILVLEEFWPAYFTEEMILPWIDIFFDRLYPTLPLLDRTCLYRDMICKRHRKDRQYGAMILSLCAFALIQPVHMQERESISLSNNYARMLLDEAFRLHSRPDLGESPVLETVLTSFFMFGCLFGQQKHNAAWLKLREAIDVATILCIQLPEAYTFLSDLERTQRLRIFFVLSVTERSYALQRNHEIEFKGRPGYIMGWLTSKPANGVSNIGQSSGIDEKAMAGLSRMMELVDTVDERFVQCWNGQYGGTTHFSKDDALLIQRKLLSTSFSTTDHAFSGMTESQEIDIRILRHWILNRLWNMCLARVYCLPQLKNLCYPINMLNTGSGDCSDL